MDFGPCSGVKAKFLDRVKSAAEIICKHNWGFCSKLVLRVKSGSQVRFFFIVHSIEFEFFLKTSPSKVRENQKKVIVRVLENENFTETLIERC